MDNAAQAPRKPGPVTENTEQRRRLQSELGEQVARLEQRLSPILGPKPPTPAAEPGILLEGRDRTHNHAEGIRQDNEDLSRILHALQVIEQRIEL